MTIESSCLSLYLPKANKKKKIRYKKNHRTKREKKKRGGGGEEKEKESNVDEMASLCFLEKQQPPIGDIACIVNTSVERLDLVDVE